MWVASRSPHKAVIARTRVRRTTSPSPADDDEGRDRDRRETEAPGDVDHRVPAEPQGDHEGHAEHDEHREDRRRQGRGERRPGEVRHQRVRTRGRWLRPSVVGRTMRIWSTPIRPSSNASAPPTR